MYSYREAESNLEKLTVHRRSVNNHNKIKLMTTLVGAVLAQENLKPPAVEDCAPEATEVIVQVDGGHIPIKERDKRSFEALLAVVYRPESLLRIDQQHREIESKSCALSAEDDNLTTMKTYLLNAARKQGMVENTKLTALADGALNCWAAILSLAPHCQQLICILDWFHIAMKFQNARSAVAEAFKDALERVKWSLWHGKAESALSQLKMLMMNVKDSKKRSKLEDLYEYLNRNQAYLVNYGQREQQSQTYTSQVAESHIQSIINARYKRSGKMQWTREGAHKVLQIRGLIASNEWGNRWQKPVLTALGVAV